MASSLGVLFIAGGFLTLLSIVLPHPETLNEAGAAVNSVIAIVAGGVLMGFGASLPVSAFQISVGLGSILIAIGVHLGGYGAETPPYAFFYVWVSVYSFYFFERRAAILQMMVGSLAHLSVLIMDGRGAVAITGWIFTWGIAAVTGFVVGWLSLRVKTLAETDSLTGVRNRRAWDTELERQLANAARSRQSFCVLLLDLDGLKGINDKHGHQAGDRVLKEAAAAWSTEIRAGDLIARLGGDEFGILLPSCTPGGAASLLVRLRNACNIRFSAGGAHWDGMESPQELLRRADADLYVAKSQGRELKGAD